jgi:hypothetical protein
VSSNSDWFGRQIILSINLEKTGAEYITMLKQALHFQPLINKNYYNCTIEQLLQRQAVAIVVILLLATPKPKTKTRTNRRM